MFGRINLENKEKALKQIARKKSYADVFSLLGKAQDDDVRQAVVARLHQLRPDAMVSLVTQSDDEVVRRAALENIESREDLMKVALAQKCDLNLRTRAVERLDRQEDLLRVVKCWQSEEKYVEMVTRAIRKIDDHKALYGIANDPKAVEDVRVAALRRSGAADDPEALCRLAAEGCLAAVSLLDRDALIRLIREAIEKAAPLMFSSYVEAANYRDRVKKEGRKPTIADSACRAIRRIDDDDLAYTLALESIRNKELESLRRDVADRIDDQPRRCKLGFHDYQKSGEAFYRDCGDTRTLYEPRKCRGCGKEILEMLESYKF